MGGGRTQGRDLIEQDKWRIFEQIRETRHKLEWSADISDVQRQWLSDLSEAKRQAAYRALRGEAWAVVVDNNPARGGH